MSGIFSWDSGYFGSRGTEGRFWSSTPVSYASSWYLYFRSTNVYPKNGDYKPTGFTLRCVARFPPKSPPLFHLNKFSELSSALQILCAFPSRALRSLPLSVMMSGYLFWGNGNLSTRGTYGYFWSSTPGSYVGSRYLYLTSTNVGPKNGYGKSYGLSLRCVARFFRTSTYAQKIIAPFLPEPSAAFPFRL